MSESEESIFEELAKLEPEFENAEVDILKYSTKLFAPLYETRKNIIAKIDQFWPSVISQVGEEIDAHITPTDNEVIDCINSIEVTRDVEDPRSFTITFGFNENEYLESTTISKTFTFIPKLPDSFSGDTVAEAERVVYKSTKVPLKWKPGKDLTETKPGEPYSFFTFFDWENSADKAEKDVFPAAHEVAILIADELYPNAIKLYIDALNEGESEDDDEEIDLEDEDDDDDEEEEEPPRKRYKK
ncbi:uncharacterized protein V1516DRAFT_663537 [Lipomyces oligophaga]|uniref:uncharacterized protein n=1 Tax=Lipomyces oligophaga TaxID=45792 RepID=UPI0034CF0C53